MVVTIRKTGPNAPTPYGLVGTQKTPGRTERFHNAFHFADKDGYPGVKPPWGILNAREEFVKDHPDLVKRVISAYEQARKYALANYPELKKIFIAVTKLDGAVVDKQLEERTELTHNKIGPAQRDSILEAGLALQKGGIIKAGADIKKAVEDLIDDRYVAN